VAARAIVAFLILAAVWTVGLPDRVSMEPPADPERHADALGVPEVFDPPAPAGGHGLDPDPHRAAIERIEDVLYQRSPSGYGDAEAVESGVLRLAETILRDEGFRGRRAGQTLLGFAGRVGARTDAGYSVPSLVALREEWEAVRASVFAPADWMRAAGPGLDRIQDPPPPPMDPRADEAILAAEAELRSMIARGQREAEQLGEPRYDPDVPGWDDGGQIRAWYRFGEAWRRELDRALAPVAALSPPPHLGLARLRAEAVRALVEAREMLRRVPDGAGMWPTPFRPAWESRFRVASTALARARDHMARAGAPPRPETAQDLSRFSR